MALVKLNELGTSKNPDFRQIAFAKALISRGQDSANLGFSSCPVYWNHAFIIDIALLWLQIIMQEVFANLGVLSSVVFCQAEWIGVAYARRILGVGSVLHREH